MTHRTSQVVATDIQDTGARPLARTFIGIDVQSARNCPYAVIDASSKLLTSGWLPVDDELEAALFDLAKTHPGSIFGVDSPRVPRTSKREWYWGRNKWRRRTSEVGWGRHCEVVISAHRLANPQWTPLKENAPEWMRIGFKIFEALNTLDTVETAHEVFPTASYEMLQSAPEARLDLSFEHFRPGPKDMLDAAIAALTVQEFTLGRGCEVGGGDGLGTIVLPRPIRDPIEAVMIWPGSEPT